MTLITLVCNTTTSMYKGDERWRVRIKKMTLSHLFCMILKHNRLVRHLFKAFQHIYQTANCKQLPDKNLHIKDVGGNDLKYTGTFLLLMKVLGITIA
jgi:hypothetical protein